MSRYEKIATGVIVFLCIIVLVLSRGFFERHENLMPERHEEDERSQFEKSIGEVFEIGSFASITDEQVSGEEEKNCSRMRSVIVAVLHDIYQRIPLQASYAYGTHDSFEINERALALFCNTTAHVVLDDGVNARLMLEKVPFERKIPENGRDADAEMFVRINGYIASRGESFPSIPTVHAEILIPERLLDTQ